MAEMIVPGTYITVRSEGLISAGRIATGIVGVVGTAQSGPLNRPVTLSGFGEARQLFGDPDDYARPEEGSSPLTLIRALSLIYNNGASTVVAVRVASASRSSATFAVPDAQGRTVAVLTAATPGTWANGIHVAVEESDEDCVVTDEKMTSGFDALRYKPVVASAQNRVRVVRGTTRRAETLDLVYKLVVKDRPVAPDQNKRFFLPDTPVENVASVNSVRVLDASGAEVRKYGDGSILYGSGGAPQAGEIRVVNDTGEIIFEASQIPTAAQRVVATYAVGHAAPGPGQVLVTTWDGRLTFAANEAPQASSGDVLTASYLVDRSACAKLTLTSGPTVERYVVPDGRLLATLVNQRSVLCSGVVDATNGSHALKTSLDAYFGTGSNTPGSNGAAADADDYAAGLDTLSNMLVNIVVPAGQDARVMGEALLGHLNQTAETDHERIGVLGAPGSTLAEALGHTLADERVVVVAPGLTLNDGTTLPSAYAAAAVAGLISSLPVQGSLTNKPLNVPGLTLAFNRGQQEQLIRRNVLALVDKEGFRVLKGVTTSGEGTAFSAIPTRRIVDYARYGVRSGANSYLGRLNNERVRGALKATLDAFLTRMTQDEALTGYELSVTATRAQEVAGEVAVVMTLQPVFSIEYIQVTMILR